MPKNEDTVTVTHLDSQMDVTRFWKHVGQQPVDQCWVWPLAKTRLGYGKMRVGDRMIHAHKFAYDNLVGAVPKGLELDHTCRNRACCNPAHLEPVTHKENMRRGAWATKTHCKHEHEYTVKNTRVYNGWRFCRECDRIRSAIRRSYAQEGRV